MVNPDIVKIMTHFTAPEAARGPTAPLRTLSGEERDCRRQCDGLGRGPENDGGGGGGGIPPPWMRLSSSRLSSFAMVFGFAAPRIRP